MKTLAKWNVPTATGGSAVAAATARNVRLENAPDPVPQGVHPWALRDGAPGRKSESEADSFETLSMPEADSHGEFK